MRAKDEREEEACHFLTCSLQVKMGGKKLFTVFGKIFRNSSSSCCPPPSCILNMNHMNVSVTKIAFKTFWCKIPWWISVAKKSEQNNPKTQRQSSNAVFPFINQKHVMAEVENKQLNLVFKKRRRRKKRKTDVPQKLVRPDADGCFLQTSNLKWLPTNIVSVHLNHQYYH